MRLFPQLIWKKQVDTPVLYLTFDDGPCEEVTDFVLEELDKFQAQATFFCVGNNVKNHPDIYNRILNSGHQIGNHTMNHENGMNYKNKEYFDSIEQANLYIGSNFFRPPFGKIKPSQIKVLAKQYQIIMWDFLTADFDKDLDIELCKKHMERYIKKGSIIVFHDSVKAYPQLKILLPYLLYTFSSKGYTFERL